MLGDLEEFGKSRRKSRLAMLFYVRPAFVALRDRLKPRAAIPMFVKVDAGPVKRAQAQAIRRLTYDEIIAATAKYLTTHGSPRLAPAS